MKQIIRAGMTFALVLFALPASAHTLKVDGNVGALLHIDPDDAPVTLATTTFNFEFGDSFGDFSSSDYSAVTATLLLGSTTLDSVNLFQQSGATDDTAAFHFVFANPGSYALTVTGVPKGNAQAFALAYGFDVGEGSSTPPALGLSSFLHEHGSHVLLVAVLALVLIVSFVMNKLRERGIRKAASGG